MLRFWLNNEGTRATGNALERALRKCNREDIVNKCIVNSSLVTDEIEKSVAKAAISHDQVTFVTDLKDIKTKNKKKSFKVAFDLLMEDLGSTMPRKVSLKEDKIESRKMVNVEMNEKRNNFEKGKAY